MDALSAARIGGVCGYFNPSGRRVRVMACEPPEVQDSDESGIPTFSAKRCKKQ
jgi:hypothetical protein